MDRRKLERKYLTFFTRVINRRNGQLIGYMADLTTGGAMLISEKPLSTGDLISISMDLPDGFPQEVLELEVRVVWTQPDIDPELHRNGLQLIGATTEEISLLSRLVSDYGFRG